MADLILKPKPEVTGMNLPKEIRNQIGHNVNKPEDNLGDKILQHWLIELNVALTKSEWLAYKTA